MGKTLQDKLVEQVAAFSTDVASDEARIRRRVSVQREIEVRLGVRQRIMDGKLAIVASLGDQLAETQLAADIVAMDVGAELRESVQALRCEALVRQAETWINDCATSELCADWAFYTGARKGSKKEAQCQRVRTIVTQKAARGWLPAAKLQAVIAMWDLIPAVINAERNKAERQAIKDRKDLGVKMALAKTELADATHDRDLYKTRLCICDHALEQWEVDFVQPAPVVTMAKVSPETPTVAKVAKVARVAKVNLAAVKPGGDLAHRGREFAEVCADAGLDIKSVRPFLDTNNMSKVEFTLRQGGKRTIALGKNWEAKVYRLAEQLS